MMASRARFNHYLRLASLIAPPVIITPLAVRHFKAQQTPLDQENPWETVKMSGSEDGWEQPKVRGRRRKQQDTHASTEKQTAADVPFSVPTVVVEGLTVEKLMDLYTKMEKEFEKTDFSRQMTEMLRKRTWAIDDAVCIGIGSFSIDWEARYRSMWQLVLFKAVVNHRR